MVHKILLSHDKNHAGKYRTKLHELEINGKTFKPSEAWKIEHEIVDLIDFINNNHKWGPKYKKHFLNKVQEKEKIQKNDGNALYRVFIAWYIHHKIVVIHPFVDGNGRVGRLIMCLVLKYVGLSYMSFPVLINYIINTNKTKYLDCLNAADKGDYIKGINYMVKILSEAYEVTVEVEKKFEAENEE